jgi:carbon storage regulator
MLVLQRRIGQSLIVGHHITVTVMKVRGKVASLGIDAPKEVGIRRSELGQEPTLSPSSETQRPARKLLR